MIEITPEGWVRETTGIWLPRICSKQLEVFNDYHRYLLVDGPRKSGKSNAICHKIFRHAFDENGARIAIFTRTTKNAKAGGIWIDLTQIIMPEWLEAGIGMKLVQAPKVTGDTRMNLFSVTNRHGTVSEIQLHSLEYCPDIVDKVKGTRFSLIFFSEIDLFEDRIVFDISTDQLRMWPNIPYEHHQFICDCNPPESGPNNWIHDLWFKEKKKEDHPNPVFQNNIHRIPFILDDNVFLPVEEKDELKHKYSYRKSLYNRFIEGMWEEDSTEGHFSEVFDPNIHVLGNIKAKERIVPTSGCRELICGFDIGDVNHAAHIVEKIVTQESESSPEYTQFLVIDEMVSLDTKITVREFTEAFMEKVEKWEEYCKENYKTKIKFRCWSDNSALRFRAAAEANDALIVREVSKGKLILQAAPKYTNSVRDRVRLTFQLLYEERLFISAQMFNTINSIRMLRRGNSPTEYVRKDQYKHAFDSLSYILISEAPLDLLQFSEVKVQKPQRKLVTV